jgi:hypothetical protein
LAAIIAALAARHGDEQRQKRHSGNHRLHRIPPFVSIGLAGVE